MQSGPSSECQAFSQQVIREHFNQCPCNNQVLFYLRIIRPGSSVFPFFDISSWYHKSLSILVFFVTFQSGSSSPVSLVESLSKGMGKYFLSLIALFKAPASFAFPISSEERRFGKACFSPFRFWWSP